LSIVVTMPPVEPYLAFLEGRVAEFEFEQRQGRS
jgi:hypothetical protein